MKTSNPINRVIKVSGVAFALALSPLLYNSAIAQETETTNEQIDDALTPEQQAEFDAYVKEAEEFMSTLSPQYNAVKLPGAGVTLNLGENFYFLNNKDGRKVLEEGWGNPPDANILGMIFAKDTNAYIYDYAVVLTFDRSGFVSDEDANEVDYGKMLADLKKNTRAANKERVRQGYEAVELIGWAEAPKYDAVNKRLHWAKSLKFGEATANTLNYNLRLLGRKGVLEFNYVADESALAAIKDSIPEMSQIASFDEGHRYADFNPNTDKMAAYGVAGLVAGGAVAKKFGLLAILLLILKKGGVFIVAGLIYFRNFFIGLFRRGKDNEVG